MIVLENRIILGINILSLFGTFVAVPFVSYEDKSCLLLRTHIGRMNSFVGKLSVAFRFTT